MGGRTRYFMGKDFSDLRDMDWTGLIPMEERANALVVLDDHQSATSRVRDLVEHRFVHLFYDDNYKTCSDCYSFNSMCSPLAEGATSVTYIDANEQVKRNISLEAH